MEGSRRVFFCPSCLFLDTHKVWTLHINGCLVSYRLISLCSLLGYHLPCIIYSSLTLSYHKKTPLLCALFTPSTSFLSCGFITDSYLSTSSHIFIFDDDGKTHQNWLCRKGGSCWRSYFTFWYHKVHLSRKKLSILWSQPCLCPLRSRRWSLALWILAQLSRFCCI